MRRSAERSFRFKVESSKFKVQSSREALNQMLQVPTGARKPPEVRNRRRCGWLRLRITVESRPGPSAGVRAGGANESSRWEAPRERSAPTGTDPERLSAPEGRMRSRARFMRPAGARVFLNVVTGGCASPVGQGFPPATFIGPFGACPQRLAPAPRPASCLGLLLGFEL